MSGGMMILITAAQSTTTQEAWAGCAAPKPPLPFRPASHPPKLLSLPMHLPSPSRPPPSRNQGPYCTTTIINPTRPTHVLLAHKQGHTHTVITGQHFALFLHANDSIDGISGGVLPPFFIFRHSCFDSVNSFPPYTLSHA
jgi:hypothetical protein